MNVTFAYSPTPKLVFDHPVQKTTPKTERGELLKRVAYYADLYNVSYNQMVATIQCESGFVTDIQSRHEYPEGGREQSYGLVQIHLPAHPSVSYEEAIDPEYAIEFMAKNFSEGRQSWWTCWRNLYQA